jgi:two-component system, OmpR family, alkaline phosphatase synthesis response regulator PhoP
MTGRVLIVGDKADEGRILHQALKRESNFLSRVISHRDLKLETVLKFEPDMIILNPDGKFDESISAYHQLKKQDATSDMPMVMILSEEEMKDPRVPSGLYDVFCRPMRAAECVARLVLIYKKSHRITDRSLISAGDLEIDVSRYEVRLNGRKVDLTYTEYELLKFMAVHPNQVFTRDILLNKVWGYEYYGGARTVDVHVRRLRAKIEGKTQPFIETIRNIGYKFISPEEED